MRNSKASLTVAIATAFAAGLVLSPLPRYAVWDARAQAASLNAAMIDLGSMKHGDIPATPNPEMNSKLLVNTDNATVAVQSGNVAKHIHPKTEGTAHGGTIVTSGPVKAIAIKIPPQPRDDVVFVN